MNEGFKVGDKVVVLHRKLYGAIGTVTKITEKRKDVVVDFGNYTARYGLDGWLRGSDAWSFNCIVLIDDKIEKEIFDQRCVSECIALLDDITRNNLTPDLARKLIAAIKAEKEGTT